MTEWPPFTLTIRSWLGFLRFLSFWWFCGSQMISRTTRPTDASFLIGLCHLAGWKRRTLAIALSFIVAVSVLLNVFFMNNIGWFLFLYIYGTLMSFWFFKRDKIQNSLPLALVTHNPVMMIFESLYYLFLFATSTICLSCPCRPFCWPLPCISQVWSGKSAARFGRQKTRQSMWLIRCFLATKKPLVLSR